MESTLELVPVRCTTCGKVLAGKIGSEYLRLRDEAIKLYHELRAAGHHPDEITRVLEERGLTIEKIFDRIGLTNRQKYCCRIELMSPITLPFPPPLDKNVIAGVKNITSETTKIVRHPDVLGSMSTHTTRYLDVGAGYQVEYEEPSKRVYLAR